MLYQFPEFKFGIADVDLTGEVRGSFQNAFGNNCSKTQSALSQNNGISDETLEKYCRCAALRT